MADSALLAAGGNDAPLSYTVPGATAIRIKQVHVAYVDNGAGADWLPMVRIVSDSKHTMGQASDQGVKVTAGSDASVTFFPVRRSGSGGAGTAGTLTWIWAWRSNNGPVDTDETFNSGVTKEINMYHVRSNDTAKTTFLPVESFTTPPPVANTPWGGDGSLVTSIQLLKSGMYGVTQVVRLPTATWAPYVIGPRLLNYAANDVNITQLVRHETNYNSDAWPAIETKFVTDPSGAGEASYVDALLGQTTGGPLTINTGGTSYASLFIVYYGDTGAAANIANW